MKAEHDSIDNLTKEYAHRICRESGVATEDIYNEKGVLVLKKGAQISEKRAEQLNRHKLTKPLEVQVGIPSQLTIPQLLNDVKELIHSKADLSQIEGHCRSLYRLEERLENLYARLPVTLQRLSVMKRQHPQMYQKSLLSTWLAALLAKELGQIVHQNNLLIAVLGMDIGMLDLPSALINKTSKYTPIEWKAMQYHVALSQKSIAASHPANKQAAAIAYLHHERCDGSGYKGKTELSLESQVLGLVDLTAAIRFNQQTVSLAQLIPVLQLKGLQFDPIICDLLIRLIKANCSFPEQLISQQACFESVDMIKKWLEPFQTAIGSLSQFAHSLSDCDSSDEAQKISLVLEDALLILHRSGLSSPVMPLWFTEQLSAIKQRTFNRHEMLAIYDLKIYLREFAHTMGHLANLIELSLKQLPDESVDALKAANSINKILH